MLLEGAELAAPAAPLNDLLRIGLGAAPDDTALVSIARSLTWRELEDESAALAGAYLGLGLREGDRIASLMPNRVDLVVHYLACFKAGLVATPLNYRYTFREIDHALEVSAAAALLAHVERAEDVAASRLAGDLACGVIAYRDPGGGPRRRCRLAADLRGSAGQRADCCPSRAGSLHSRGDLLHLGSTGRRRASPIRANP